MSADLDARWKALGSPWRAGMRVGYTFLDMPAITFWDRLLDDSDTMAESGLCVSEASAEPYAGTPNPIRMTGPDWNDAGTLGVLLGLVRKKWGDPYAYVMGDADGFECFVADPNEPLHGERCFARNTEAGALLAALEAHHG